MSSPRSLRFINYPDPQEGPSVPYQNTRKTNPPLKGQLLVFSAMLMEWFAFVRTIIWKNAGFGSLRKIRDHLLESEPRYDPTVLPAPSAAPVPAVPAAPGTFEEEDMSSSPKPLYYSVADYRRMYLSGELTPLAVAKALLPLIQKDTFPPGEHSTAWYDTKVEHVLRMAEESTQRYLEKRPLGPLDGIPTAVKDEYEIDGYKTCLGSKNDYTSEPCEAGTTSWCVQKLQEAGALVLGKLNMHEFGLDTTGNNPVHGTPRNPYNDQYYTGGSSSGSAYVVAAGLVPVALGSDGGGSIRIPASFCGVFGLKPSHGRVSFRPGPNHGFTCAVNGPLGGDIRSLAAFLDVIAAPDPTSSFSPVSGFLSSHSRASGKKILGIPNAWFAQAAPAVQQLCRSMIDRLVAERGYETVSIDIPFLVEGQVAHALTLLTDAATLLPELKTYTPANRILLAIGRTTPATDYLLAQKLRGLLMRHLAYLWKTYPGMVIVTPTTGCAGWPIGSSQGELRYGISDGDRTIKSMEYVWIGNFCGVPALTVPAGYVVPEGAPGAGNVAGDDVAGRVPVGLMATGEWTDEANLLRFGLDAEVLGMETRVRPPRWVDVVALAKEEMKRGAKDGSETMTTLA